ncbi:hypothetical protein I4U23_011769 [Adineta vaga]|nr:hypothetical protein I4U23_011769 [Adineta vaga]
MNSSTLITSNNTNINRRRYSVFEWIQLIATIFIPVIIGVYTIIDNNNNTSITMSNRMRDIKIANISRTSAYEIAEANRLMEIHIAEQSRQKDRDLSIDQQHQIILTNASF